MNQPRVFWSICGSCLCALLGCGHDPTAVQGVQRIQTESVASKTTNNREAVESTVLVETQVFVETGGITVLALLAQSNVDAYVESVVNSSENLSAAVAALKNGRSADNEKLTIAWLADNVRVRQIGSGIVGIGIRASADDESETIAIVNAIAESFCNREPKRIADEVRRLRSTLKERLSRDPSEENAFVVQNLNRAFDSERFKEMPEIVAKALASKQ